MDGIPGLANCVGSPRSPPALLPSGLGSGTVACPPSFGRGPWTSKTRPKRTPRRSQPSRAPTPALWHEWLVRPPGLQGPQVSVMAPSHHPKPSSFCSRAIASYSASSSAAVRPWLGHRRLSTQLRQGALDFQSMSKNDVASRAPAPTLWHHEGLVAHPPPPGCRGPSGLALSWAANPHSPSGWGLRLGDLWTSLQAYPIKSAVFRG